MCCGRAGELQRSKGSVSEGCLELALDRAAVTAAAAVQQHERWLSQYCTDLGATSPPTGAGISCASGIPDFRSSAGLFESLKKQHPEARLSSGKDLFDASLFSVSSSFSAQRRRSEGAAADPVARLPCFPLGLHCATTPSVRAECRHLLHDDCRAQDDGGQGQAHGVSLVPQDVG